jgi:hypothetical protein
MAIAYSKHRHSCLRLLSNFITLIFCPKQKVFYDKYVFLHIMGFFLRNLNSNLCTDHNNKINVLPQLPAPSILFNLTRS